MTELIVHVLSFTFFILPFVGLYVTYVHYKWLKSHGPSPLLKHLFIACIALDVASFTTMIVAVASFFDRPLPAPWGAILISFALYLALGVKIWRRFNLRALDSPDTPTGEPRIETQDQREDREFGDKRRKLENRHIEEVERASKE